MKKRLFFTFLLLHLLGTSYASNTFGDNDIISKYRHLSLQQLLDTGDYNYYENLYDAALICYSLVMNTSEKDTDIEGKKKIIEAYNKSAIIYNNIGDYRTSYQLLLNGLELCEKYGDDEFLSPFYTNIGVIYYYFEKYDISKSYALQALATCKNDISMITILNNLGMLEMKIGEMDSVLDYFNRSLQISKQNNDTHSHVVLNSIATYYQHIQQYDSAFYYFRYSLDEIGRKYKNMATAFGEARNLSELGKLFFETNQKDSALFHIDLSNAIATDNNFYDILAENYAVLSQIEESRGRGNDALGYFRRYVFLKDSLFNVDRYGEINQIQRLYEISQTNKQIEQLSIEQQIQERTIRYHQIIQLITFCVLILIGTILLIVYVQKRKLNKAYETLFEKNKEIIEIRQDSPDKQLGKYGRSMLSDEMQKELLDKIVTLMEDTPVICDVDFSLDKLAEMVQSNHTYVSQVINTALQKNFRSFLNSYRIREAQRLFSEPDSSKYTIEFMALQVGFKSSSTFRVAFKEITGVSPNYYLKSMHKQHSYDK